LPATVQGLATPGATTPGIPYTGYGFLNDLFDSGGNIGMYNYTGAAVGFGSSGIMGGIGLAAAQSSTATAPAAAAAPAALGAGLGGTLTGAAAPAGTAAAGAPVLASVGQASTVGRMSVPTTWSTATPESSAETLTAAQWSADVDDGGVTNVATGMPAVASTGRGSYGLATPRYGVKPTVMPTRVLV
jgi:hypothetical protein